MRKTQSCVVCLTLVMLLLFSLALTGCNGKAPSAEDTTPAQTVEIDGTEEPGAEPSPDPTPEPTPSPTPMPTATSADAELYLSEDGEAVVNAYGQPAEGYSVDAEGNIVDSNNDYVVAASNTDTFTVYTRISFDKITYPATLSAKEEPVGDDPNVTHVVQYPSNVTIKLSLNPAEATNKVIILSIADQTIAGFALNNANADILAEGSELEAGKIAVMPKEGEDSISIVVTAKSRGETKIFADAICGEASDVCSIKVTTGTAASSAPEEPQDEYVIASLDEQIHHVHVYSAEVVAPTIYAGGYTIHTCTICGHSYTDNYTSKLPPQPEEPAPHVHSYVATIIAPTATEGGYTQHTCTGCGDTYKDSFTDPLGGGK